MPFPIPKIEYLNTTVVGNSSNGSALLTSLVSTSALSAGMFARGTGIPAGTTIVSVDSSTQVTLSANATANGTGVSFDFGFLVDFEYPPIEPAGETMDAKEHISVSISGIRQISVDHVELKRKLKFSSVSQTIKLTVDTFMSTHAIYGRSFRYFDDKLSLSYITVELNSLKYDPKKIAPKGIEVYSWEFPMELRRVA